MYSLDPLSGVEEVAAGFNVTYDREWTLITGMRLRYLID